LTVEVVTVFAPRPDHEKWTDYYPLLRAQRASVLRAGHRHVVVTDADLGGGFDTLRVPLPGALMPAMIQGLIAKLARGGDSDLLLVDVDCLIARDLAPAFVDERDFDVLLTRRAHPTAPVNNGAMYVRRAGIRNALGFFKHALALCREHWGADQEAISQAAAPVPEHERIADRVGCRIKFASMKPYNVVPKILGKRHNCDPFVVHFKGDGKSFMLAYAERYLSD
jgi:hypothetical protein